jgi:putative Holliday junction resolvase
MTRILGIDYGRSRVGVAISDELQLLAHPVETISAKTNVIGRIAEIVRDRKVDKVIVGIPRNMSGELGTAAAEVKIFVQKLRGAVDCEVSTWDERLTTAAAERALHEAGRTTRQSRGYVDQVAAQMILQGYLDHLQTAAERPENG